MKITDKESPTQQSPNQSPKPLSFFSVIQSVLAAMFGVQSEHKRQKDFQSGDAGSFIFMGVVMVIIFVLTIVFIVNQILDTSAK